MKKYINGQYLDMTEDEIAAVEEAGRLQEVRERRRPLTEREVSAMLLRQQINTIEVDDQTALRMLEFYPKWEEMVGKTAEGAGFKFIYDGKLYKTVSPNHTFAAHWVPGAGTESLYARIDEEHAGDRYDPIPYEGNMELKLGLYYRQNGVLYLCIRDTGNPVYNKLSELAGLYVEIADTEDVQGVTG